MHVRRTIVGTLTATAIAVTAAGCGSNSAGANQAAVTVSPTGTASTAGASAQATAAAPRPPSAKTISVRIADGKVTPKAGRVSVSRGDAVRLVVTSDVKDELHVHGYDIEEPLEPGTPTTVQLDADRAGLFEVETHETGLVLLQLLVR